MTRATPDTLRRLAAPRPARVELDAAGAPMRVDGHAVEAVRERWVVEEGWWTDMPIRRAYLELVLTGGRLVVVFQDRRRGSWHLQR